MKKLAIGFALVLVLGLAFLAGLSGPGSFGFSLLGGDKAEIKRQAYAFLEDLQYKDFKKKFSSSGKANMELTGDMLDALDWENLGGNSLEVGLFDPEQAAKAHKHNTSDKYPRQFIPAKDQQFNDKITTGIEDIIASFAEDQDEPAPVPSKPRQPVEPEAAAVSASFDEGFLSVLLGE